MSENEALDYIESEIKNRIQSFDERRSFYRTGTYRFTIGSAFLSALTTFLIGVGQIYDLTWPSVLSLATSASMTVLVAWNSFFSFRQRWVQNNDILMRLYKLRSDINYKKASADNISAIEIDAFYTAYGEILREANNSWKVDRQSNGQS